MTSPPPAAGLLPPRRGIESYAGTEELLPFRCIIPRFCCCSFPTSQSVAFAVARSVPPFLPAGSFSVASVKMRRPPCA